MRLRNIPRADGVIDAHHTVIKKSLYFSPKGVL